MDNNKAYVLTLLAALGAVGAFIYAELSRISAIEGENIGANVWLDRWMSEREKRYEDRAQIIGMLLEQRDKRIASLEKRIDKLENCKR